MLVPLSWLKEYVNIKSDVKSLGLKLTDVGLGCEKIEKTKDNDTVFDGKVIAWSSPALATGGLLVVEPITDTITVSDVGSFVLSVAVNSNWYVPAWRPLTTVCGWPGETILNDLGPAIFSHW